MSEQKHNIIVGITVIAGMAGVVFMLLLFGLVPGWLSPSYIVHAHMMSSGGLTPGSRVRLNGLDIGVVEAIALRQPVTDGVDVTFRVQDAFEIPSHAVATVPAPLLAGSPALQLAVDRLPPGEPLTYLPKDGSAQITARPLGQLEAMLGSNDGLEGMTELLATLNQRLDRMEGTVTDAISDVRKLASTWTAVGENVREMTTGRSADEVDEGAPATLASVVDRTDQTLREVKLAMGDVRQITGNDAFQGDLRTAAQQARELTEKLNATATRLDGTLARADDVLANAGTGVEQLVQRYVSVADSLGETLNVARTLLVQANNPEGSVGKLLNDPSLYENLDAAADRAGHALKELDLLIQKWKAEGLPVKF